MIDINYMADKNPKLVKTVVLTALAIVSLIEPTPVLEIVTGIVSVLPAEDFAKFVKILNSNPWSFTGMISKFNAIRKNKKNAV